MSHVFLLRVLHHSISQYITISQCRLLSYHNSSMFWTSIYLRPVLHRCAEETIDPVGNLLCMLEYERMQVEACRMVVKFPQKTVDGIASISKSGLAFLGQSAQISAKSHTAFNRTESGLKAITDWMLALPRLFAEKGHPSFLDNGSIKAWLGLLFWDVLGAEDLSPSRCSQSSHVKSETFQDLRGSVKLP